MLDICQLALWPTGSTQVEVIMGLFDGLFKKGNKLPSSTLEVDPFSMAVPFIRMTLATTILGVSTVWSLGYYEAAVSAVTYYTMYSFCMANGSESCKDYSNWLGHPLSMGVPWELTDSGTVMAEQIGLVYNPGVRGTFCTTILPVMIAFSTGGTEVDMGDYCNNDFLGVDRVKFRQLFAPGDTFSVEKYESKGELASSSLLIHFYRGWIERQPLVERLLACHPHEYINESQLLANQKFCYDFDVPMNVSMDRTLLDDNLNGVYLNGDTGQYVFPIVRRDVDNWLQPTVVAEKEFLDAYTKADHWRFLLALGVWMRYTYIYYIVAWVVSPIGPFDLGYKLLIDKESQRDRQKKREEILNSTGGKRK